MLLRSALSLSLSLQHAHALFPFSLSYLRKRQFSGFGWWLVQPVAEAPPPPSLLALPTPVLPRGMASSAWWSYQLLQGCLLPLFCCGWRHMTNLTAWNQTQIFRKRWCSSGEQLSCRFLPQNGCYKLLLSAFRIVSFYPVLCHWFLFNSLTYSGLLRGIPKVALTLTSPLELWGQPDAGEEHSFWLCFFLWLSSFSLSFCFYILISDFKQIFYWHSHHHKLNLCSSG